MKGGAIDLIDWIICNSKAADSSLHGIAVSLLRILQGNSLRVCYGA